MKNEKINQDTDTFINVFSKEDIKINKKIIIPVSIIGIIVVIYTIIKLSGV